ncbi:MAG: trypsin-like peptidase domain-containing protein [Bacteroidota bacterium]
MRYLSNPFCSAAVLFFFLFLGITFNSRGQQMDGVLLTKRALPGIVKIEVENGSGTGFIIGRGEETFILTNFHVIAKENYYDGYTLPALNSIAITNSGLKTFRCTGIISYDEELDIAVLSFLGNTDIELTQLPILPYGEEPMGASISTIGNPFGDNFSYVQGTVFKVQNEYVNFPARTDMPVNPGNSGGPVLNKLGQVAGMVTARMTHFFDGDLTQGFNYYINAETIREFLRNSEIPYSTKPLILAGEITERELSEQEQNAIIEKNLKIQQAEQEKEIAKINKQKETELKVLEAEQRSKMSEAEKKAIREKIETEKELIRLEKEAIAHAKALRNEQKRLSRASLPPRVSTRIGMGALVYGGNADYVLDYFSSSEDVNSPKIAINGQLSLGYRFTSGVRNIYTRATSINVFLSGGSFNSTSIQHVLQDYPGTIMNDSKSDFFPYFETEGGFLFKEWYRLSAGIGRQYLQNDLQTIKYGTLTTGFIIPGGAIESDFLFLALYGKEREQLGFRFHLLLNLHFKYLNF